MAKRKAQDKGAAGSFLIALIKQLNAACDDDLEEWFAFGEIVGLALDCVGWEPEGPDGAEAVDDGEASVGPHQGDARNGVTPASSAPVARAPGDAAQRAAHLAEAARLGGELASLPPDLLQRVVRGVLGGTVAGLRSVKLPHPKACLDEELIDG